jgi:hypothetical protein
LRISLDSSIVAVSISIAVLTGVGLSSFPLWNYIYSVSLAWVLSDFILNLIVQGGGGWLKIPFASNDFAAKGKGYLAFFFGIVLGTWLSSFGSDFVFNFVGLAVSKIPSNSTQPIMEVVNANPTLFTLLFANIIVGCIVFLDLNVRFYKK